MTKSLDFTPLPCRIQMELEPIRASGGGDHPECLTSALFDCAFNLTWRSKAIKVMIVITDAPPHGIETSVADGFPDEDVNTFAAKHGANADEKTEEGATEADAETKHLDTLAIVRRIRDELGAAIYSVGCEPSLSCNADFAIDFMRYLAEFTKGNFYTAFRTARKSL